jgi:hypothetical protein
MNAEEEMQQGRNELLNRLDLMESMVQEGRRRTKYWGWTQVLWGTAYLVAIGWSNWLGQSEIAWPVTMTAAVVITIAVGSRQKREHRQTTIARALGATWIAIGTAIVLYCFSTSISGHFEIHSFFCAVEAFLGAANCASALVLRWRVQLLVSVVWWISAIATCFVGTAVVMPILIGDTLACLIGFGLYLMYCERRDRLNPSTVVQHG